MLRKKNKVYFFFNFLVDAAVSVVFFLKKLSEDGKKKEMETHCIISGHENITSYLVNLFRRAEKTIHISSPRINFDSKYLRELLTDVCRRGVKVNILVGEDSLSSSSSSSSSSSYLSLPAGCSVRMVKNFGPDIKSEFVACTPTVMKILTTVTDNGDGDGDDDRETDENSLLKILNQPIYKHNQSYIVIDFTVSIIGSFSRHQQ